MTTVVDLPGDLLIIPQATLGGRLNGHRFQYHHNINKDVGLEFFDRLVATALPRIRDFRGLSTRSFDGRGNYSLGVADQTVFPEIELDKIKRQQGMDITIVTSAQTDDEAMELLKMMGMPFAEGR